MKRLREANLITFTGFALLAAILWAMYWLHPATADDQWYMEWWTDNTFTDIVGTYIQHFFTDNGRLANLAGLILLKLPKPLSAAILAGSVISMFVTGAAMAGIVRRPLLSALYVALLIVALPWAHYMFTIIFAANYVIASALALLIIYNGMYGRLRNPAAAIAAGLTIGLWHECFGVAVIMAVIGQAIAERRIYRWQIVMITAAIVGIVYLFMAPGTALRADRIEPFYGLRHPLFKAAYATPFYVLISVMLILAVKRSRLWRRLSFVMLAFFATGTYLVWRSTTLGLQMTFPLNLASITALFCLFQHKTTINRPTLASACLLWGIIVGYMGWCATYFCKIKAEYDQACELTRCFPGITLKSQITRSVEVPTALLGKPNFNALTAWNMQFSRVIPPDLPSFRSNARNIDGGYVFRNIHIVVPFDKDSSGTKRFVTIFFEHRAYYTACTLVPFTDECGDRWLYINPGSLPMFEAGWVTGFSYASASQ